MSQPEMKPVNRRLPVIGAMLPNACAASTVFLFKTRRKVSAH